MGQLSTLPYIDGLPRFEHSSLHQTAGSCNCALHLPLAATREGLKPICREMPWVCPGDSTSVALKDPPPCNTGGRSDETQPVLPFLTTEEG